MFASLPHRSFPGGTALRHPLMVLAMVCGTRCATGYERDFAAASSFCFTPGGSWFQWQPRSAPSRA